MEGYSPRSGPVSEPDERTPLVSWVEGLPPNGSNSELKNLTFSMSDDNLQTLSNTGSERKFDDPPSSPCLDKRYLVTGGCGFLGRYLVEHLVTCGASVRVFDIADPPLGFPDVEFVKGDIRRFQDVGKAVRDIDVIFHSASLLHSAAKWQEYFSVNVDGTKNVVSAALGNSVSQIIYTSTSNVVMNGQDVQNGDESLAYPEVYLDSYSKTKSLAEQVIRKVSGTCNSKGVPLLTIAIRPHCMFGPRDTHFIAQMVTQAAQGSITHMVGEGLNVTDFTYVENVVHAHILATEGLSLNEKLGGKVYFITNGRPVFFWTFLYELLDEIGCPRPSKKMSWTVAWILAILMEFIHWAFGWMTNWYPPVTRAMVATMSRHHWFSHAKATRDLNYRPIVTTDDGLKRTGEWFKEKLKPIRRIPSQQFYIYD